MTVPLIAGQARFGLIILGTPVTSATVGEAYDGFTLTARGGVAPYVFSVVASGGHLPAEITLGASTGVVSTGSPSAAAEISAIVIRVTDAAGATADLAPFNLSVAEASSTPAWVTALAAPGDDLPIVALDFANARYWAGGAEVLVAAVISDPTKVTGGALTLTTSDLPVSLIGAALAAGIATSLTVLIDCAFAAASVIVANNEDDSEELYYLSYNGSDPLFVDVSGYTNDAGYDVRVTAPAWTTGVAQRIAFTVTPTAQAVSVDGEAVSTSPNSNAVTPTPTRVLFGHYDPAHVVLGNQTISLLAFYAAQPNADLHLMSA